MSINFGVRKPISINWGYIKYYRLIQGALDELHNYVVCEGVWGMGVTHTTRHWTHTHAQHFLTIWQANNLRSISRFHLGSVSISDMVRDVARTIETGKKNKTCNMQHRKHNCKKRYSFLGSVSYRGVLVEGFAVGFGLVSWRLLQTIEIFF